VVRPSIVGVALARRDIEGSDAVSSSWMGHASSAQEGCFRFHAEGRQRDQGIAALSLVVHCER
jgi:hypothetical protein